ncbi:MAG: helix-turn-helix domain-containing protein [Gemmatimonadales bacterium]
MDAVATFPIPARTRFRRHGHDGPHLCLVLAGGFLERQGRGWCDVGPGQLRVSNGATHDINFGPAGARCLVLEGIAEAALPRAARLPRPRFFARDPALWRLGAGLARATLMPEPDRALEVDALATELLAQVERRVDGRVGPAPPWLARVRELIHDGGGRSSVAELATEAGVHRVHLARVFREHCGVPVTSYRRRVRIAAAVRRLAVTSAPVSRIACETGFADQAHLTRALKSRLGLTPGRLRRAHVTGIQDGEPTQDEV